MLAGHHNDPFAGLPLTPRANGTSPRVVARRRPHRRRTALQCIVRELLAEVLGYLSAPALCAVELASKQLWGLVQETCAWRGLFRAVAGRRSWSFPPPLIPVEGAASEHSSCRLPVFEEADSRGGTMLVQHQCHSPKGEGCARRISCRRCWEENDDSWKHAFHMYQSELWLRKKFSRNDSSAVFVLRVNEHQKLRTASVVHIPSREFELGPPQPSTASGPMRWKLDLVKNPSHPDIVFVCLSLNRAFTVRAFFSVHLVGTNHSRATSHSFEHSNRWYHRLPLSLIKEDLVLELDLTVLPDAGPVHPTGIMSRLLHVTEPPPSGRVMEMRTVRRDTVTFSALDMLRLTKRSVALDRPPTFSAGRRHDGGAYEWTLTLQPSNCASRQHEAWMVLAQAERVCVFFEMRVRDPSGRAIAEHCALHYFPGAVDGSVPKKGGCRFPADLFKTERSEVELSVVAFDDDDVACVNFAFALATRRLVVGNALPPPVPPIGAFEPPVMLRRLRPSVSSVGSGCATDSGSLASTASEPLQRKGSTGSAGTDDERSSPTGDGGKAGEWDRSPAVSADLVYDCVYSAGFFIADRRMERLAQRHASADVVKLFCDASASPRLRSAASSTIWNLLDSAPIALDLDQVASISETINTHLGHLLELRSRPGDEANPYTDARMAECLPQGGSESHEQIRRTLIRSMVGILSNLSVQRQCQVVMLRTPTLIPKVLDTVRLEDQWESHFSCFNLVTMICFQGLLPAHLVGTYRSLLSGFCGGEGMSGQLRQKFNMRISLRDVTDFFIPLVTSTNLDCIRFGLWCMELMYCTDCWQGDRTNI